MSMLLQRYIIKTIFYATAMTLTIMSSIMLLLLLLAELKSLGVGDYDLLQASIYILLKFPAEIYHFSAIIILLGVMVGLNNLLVHRELVVMRGAGFNTLYLLIAIFLAAFFNGLFFTAFGEGIAPYLSYLAEMKKENAKTFGQAVVTASGVWLHIDNNFIHVQQIIDRQLLENVTRYQFNTAQELTDIFYAKKLNFHDKQWVMHDTVQTHLYADQAISKHYDILPLNIRFNSSLLNIGLVGPAEMTLPKLNKYVNYLEQNGLQTTELRYIFWQRLFQPLLAILLVFVCVPLMLRPVKSKLVNFRLIGSILIGFSFYILNAILAQAAIVYQLPPLLAAMTPLMISLVAALSLSRWLLF